MTELERALATLEIDWPDTPAFDVRAPAPSPRRWLLAVAVAVVVAVGCALAVPQSRGAILRFLHLGGVTIERVDTLPSAQERALRASLGTPITPAEARRLLGREFAARGVPLYRAGQVVSALLPGNVLLSELAAGNDPALLKKFAAGSTAVEGVELGPGIAAIWIHGGHHVFLEPELPARYAGNTLLWQRGRITYRLEGHKLTRADAIRLARTLR
jgi:hypothetical protein